MTLLELPPMTKPHRKRAAPSERHLPAADTLPARSMQGGLLQFQLKRLIGELLVQGDLNPDTRASLLRHLAINPDHPELVLLAHLRDIQDPNDLPPY
jgi:hypothetical protein